MVAESNKDYIEKKKATAGRHSRFGAVFQFKRKLNGTVMLTNHLVEDRQKIINVIENQRKKPEKRKDFRKQLESSLFRKQITGDIDIRFDEGENESNSLRGYIKEITKDFIENCFNSLVQKCYDDIYKSQEQERTMDQQQEQERKICYQFLLQFGMSFVRLEYEELKRVQGRSELHVADVQQAVQMTQVEMIYMSIVRETLIKRSLFNLRVFHSSILCFLELLYLIRSMQNDPFDQNNRKNARILLNSIFKHEITKYISLGIRYCLKGLCNDEVLIRLVQIQGVFFELLQELHGQDKLLTLKTGRIFKKKKKVLKPRKKNKKRAGNQVI